MSIDYDQTLTGVLSFGYCFALLLGGLFLLPNPGFASGGGRARNFREPAIVAGEPFEAD